ncbi:SMI1/KNR4 family protein [Paenibacillus sp. OSY-SE]|uniref:SMI1/KNR4 family protein n=1 Tax=Paenibacillus sp. OSY-SE TaxID=1196323 RepID=UPI0002FFF864|nr:SMI1/KNR4 family protein [Paenibacillus sp. OSY-SE]
MKEERALIKDYLDSFLTNVDPLAFMSVEENVPDDMRAGEVDEEGWVNWKLIPSTITDEEIRELEAEFSISFPPLLKALLQTYHYIDLHFNNVKEEDGYKGDCRFIEMPAMSSEDRLSNYRFLLQSWEPLLAAGYVPFTECEDSQGPVCFDTLRMDEDGDCPVIWILHDYLHELGEDGSRVRANVLPYVNDIFASFREMIMTLCSLRNTEEQIED